MDQDHFPKLLRNDHASRAAYHIFLMQLNYLSGNYRRALAEAKKVKECFSAIAGFMITVECNFYHSLAITAIYHQMSPGDRRKNWKSLQKNQRELKKWADSCPANFGCQYFLVAAETARLTGRELVAMSLYDQAIRAARENGSIQNEALANELAAGFYRAVKRDKIARVYLTDACRGYARWGATAKENALRELYPDCCEQRCAEDLNPSQAETVKKAPPFSERHGNEPAERSDGDTLRQAIRHLAAETDPDKLLAGFLDLALDSAAADRGCLILEKDGELFIEAARTEDPLPVTKARPIPVEKCEWLSRAVVRYVFRTLETVALGGGEPTGIFAGDDYFSRFKPKSLACLPILFRGIPAGVIYLENSLHEGGFTPERLELLQLLSVQMVYLKKLQIYLEGEPEATKRREKTASMIEALTGRETQVLQLIAAGLSNKEIAARLGLTANTVKGYIKNIYGKLGANRRVQVAARAKELELIEKYSGTTD